MKRAASARQLVEFHGVGGLDQFDAQFSSQIACPGPGSIVDEHERLAATMQRPSDTAAVQSDTDHQGGRCGHGVSSAQLAQGTSSLTSEMLTQSA